MMTLKTAAICVDNVGNRKGRTNESSMLPCVSGFVPRQQWSAKRTTMAYNQEKTGKQLILARLFLGSLISPTSLESSMAA
jgi:hypothetical protein